MALTKGFVTTAGTTASDARFFEQSLVVKNTNDVPRGGLLYGAMGPLVAMSNMTLTIPDQVVFAVTRGSSDGVNIVTVSGTYTVKIAGAPASNSRIDVIYIKHNDTSFGDADSNPVIDVVQGDAAASPLPKAIPTGAMQIGTIQVPAGATTTSSSGVVLTNTIPGTALVGTPIRYRNLTAMNADAANVIDGSLGYVKGGDLYWMRGGSWSQATGDTGWVPIAAASGYASSGSLAYRRLGSVVYLRGQVQPISGNVAAATVAVIPSSVAPAQNTAFSASGSGTTYAKLLVNSDGTIATGTPSATTPYLRFDGIVYPIG